MATVQKVSSGIIVTFKAPIELNISSTDTPFSKKIYHKDSKLAKYIHQLSPSESTELSQSYEQLQVRLKKLFDQGHLSVNPEASQWELTEVPKLHDMRAYRPNLSDSLFLPMSKDICEQLKKMFTIKLDATLTFTGFTIRDSFGGAFSKDDQRQLQQKLGNSYTAYPNFHVDYRLSEAECIDAEF